MAAALVAAAITAGCGAELGAGGNGAATAALSGAPAGTKAPFNPFAPEGGAESLVRDVIKNPTLAQIREPGPLPEYSLGRSDAPVVMVKYMSLTCPYCRKFMAETFPVLKRDYIDTGKVRLVIREFPIGKSSGNATIALRCAPMDQYLTLYRKYLEQQPKWVSQEVRTDAIFAVASQVGMTRPQFDACLKNQSMIDGLKQVKERGRKLGIIGTPNFFIQDRLVKNVIGMAEIRAIVDPMLAGGARSSAPTGRQPG